MRSSGSARARLLACAAAACFGLSRGPASATELAPPELARIEAQLAEQARRIADQETRLKAQQVKIEALEAERDTVLANLRAAGPGKIPQMRLLALGEQPPNVVTELPSGPVGEAPQTAPPPQVTALPPAMNVLSPRGRLILDPAIEYVRTSNNRLVFRGVEIVPGVQFGVIEATDAARDTAVATLSARYGLTDRLELEARLPYVYRHDRFSLLAQTTPDFEGQEQNLRESGLGDVEVAARYQLNSGRGGWPIFVANGRVKPPTGSSPYEVAFDENGVAQGLATGSGFWSAEGGVTMIYPSEPAIIFGGLTYLHNFARDIDRTIGERRVGRVDPGDSIGAQVGFGLSLNPRFSVSLGYSHNYIFPTKSVVGATRQESRSLQAGSMLMGWSFRVSDRLTLNNSFEFGVTQDAPDLRFVLRAPYRF
jgi:hypothetical protein